MLLSKGHVQGSPKGSKERLLNSLIWFGVGFLALTVVVGVASLFSDGEQFYDALAVCMYALAAFSVGGLIGFIFGIPRSHQQRALTPQGASDEDDPDQDEDALVAGRPSTVSSNTNLEDISDWLTKILVGVGLTQVTSFWKGFGALTTTLGAGFGGGAAKAEPLIGAVLVTFAVAGFMISYLLTRLVLTKEFSKVNRELSQRHDVKALMKAQDYVLDDSEPRDPRIQFERQQFFANFDKTFRHLTKREQVDLKKRFSQTFLKQQNVQVSQIKQHLRDQGLYSDRIDDVFDDPLVDSITEFQTKENLIADGILGISTYNKLKQATGTA